MIDQKLLRDTPQSNSMDNRKDPKKKKSVTLKRGSALRGAVRG